MLYIGLYNNKYYCVYIIYMYDYESKVCKRERRIREIEKTGASVHVIQVHYIYIDIALWIR